MYGLVKTPQIMTECPICFKKANYTTHCNHTFCKTCLYKWKNTCPLCRRVIVLEYPNTRAMSKQGFVENTIIRSIKNMTNAPHKDKLKIIETLLHFVWNNRIIIRKDGNLCKVIQAKSLLIESQCKRMGLSPPEILKKTNKI